MKKQNERLGAADLRTNRDLYLFVAQLAREHAEDTRSLTDYLQALLTLAASYREHDALTLPKFAQLLEGGFEHELTPFDGGALHPASTSQESYPQWEAGIRRQIADLREMDDVGLLRDEYRYYGIDSPRGSRWYNFDPCTFLECAVAGTFDGWEPDDPTGRCLVPGKVAVVDNTGHITLIEPSDIKSQHFEIQAISWETFADFLWCGQSYE